MKYLFVILMLSVIGCGDLEWLDVSAEKMTYNEAVDYCKERGGRLPTINELRTLIRNCPATETGGECAVTNSCAERECWSDVCYGCDEANDGRYSVFGDTSAFWSSTTYTDRPTNYAWVVYFSNGNVRYLYKAYKYNVRCVR